MEAPLAISLTTLMAFVGGVALWSESPAPAARVSPAAGAAPAAFVFAATDGAATRAFARERTLARAAVLLLDESARQRAHCLDRMPVEIALGEGRPAAAIGPRRGLPWQAVDATPRAVLLAVLGGIADHARDAGGGPDFAAETADALRGATIAWAGEPDGPRFYLRVHAARFACELLTSDADGKVQAAWCRLAE